MIEADIAKSLHVAQPYVRLVAKTASHRYKTYEISKKAGGSRTIHHPARELKLLQTWLVENIFLKLPVHAAAAAYRSGSSVRKHADMHRRTKFLLRIDFRDFFHSITGNDVVHILSKKLTSKGAPLVNAHDRGVIRDLVCRNNRLTIGAPSSPVLSNAIMYDFDHHWARKCHARNIVYTRYADDLYFSTNTPNILTSLLEEIRMDLRERKHPLLQINDPKTVFTSSKRRKLVTGVVITPEKRLSLGRKKKRYIKSLLFKSTRGELSAEQSAYLRGFISFAKSVEPSFVQSLLKKYGRDALASALEDAGSEKGTDAR